MTYISFVGVIEEPSQILQDIARQKYGPDGQSLRLCGLEYQCIDQHDSIEVWMAKISVENEQFGHLVVECEAAGWEESCFCELEGIDPMSPMKSADNFNPNPTRQLC